MSRFKLSLRDLFIAITALCVQFGLLAAFFSMKRAGQDWLVMLVSALSSFLVPVSLAVVISDFRRHRPLFAGVVAFVLTTLLVAWEGNNLIYYLLVEFRAVSLEPFYALVVWCIAVTTGFVCAWITRSLAPVGS
jgi:hypothetical protein